MSSSDSELEFTSSKSSKNKKNKSKKTKKHPTAGVPEVAPPPVVAEVISSSSDESSSSEDGGYGKQQALGIDPLEVRNYDGKSAPQNGSQYLLSVIQETKKSPKVVVADLCNRKGSSSKSKPVNYLDSFDKEIHCDVLLKLSESNPYLPTLEWREDKLKDFSLLRSKIEQLRELITTGATRIKIGDNFKLPETGNRVVWQRFCFGLKFEEIVSTRHKEAEVKTIISTYFKDLKVDSEKLKQPEVTDTATVELVESSNSRKSSDSTTSDGVVLGDATEEPGKNGCKPLMSLMLLLSQQQIRQLIYYQSEWIEKYGFINKCQGEWLYALLSCVEKPLEPSSMADIRMICKSLIIIRNNFTSNHNNTDHDDAKACDGGKEPKTVDMKDLSIESDVPENSEYINSLNLFIYLIADYFYQKDLVTEMS